MNDSNNLINDYEYLSKNNESNDINQIVGKIKIRSKSNEQRKIDDDIYKDVMMPIQRVISKQQQQTQTCTFSQSQLPPVTGECVLFLSLSFIKFVLIIHNHD